MTKHKFRVGQTVELAPPTQRHALGVYQIIALLPIEQGEPQYRKQLPGSNDCADRSLVKCEAEDKTENPEQSSLPGAARPDSEIFTRNSFTWTPTQP